MIRAVAIDLDETLLTSDKQISEPNKEAVRRAMEAGCHIILATARRQWRTRKYAEQLGLDRPIICDNGARVFGSPNGPLWREAGLPMAVAQRVCEVADSRGWELSTVVGEINYLRQRPGQPLGLLEPGLEVVVNNSDALLGAPLRIFAWEDPAILFLDKLCQQEFSDQCRTDVFYETDGSLNSMGIFGHGADKADALQLVLEKLGIQPENVMAIGDNSNDLRMLELVGVGVAMGNAIPEAKAIANVIAPTNNDHGVAWAIEQYVLS